LSFTKWLRNEGWECASEHGAEAVGEVRGENTKHPTSQSGETTSKSRDLAHSPPANVRR